MGQLHTNTHTTATIKPVGPWVSCTHTHPSHRRTSRPNPSLTGRLRDAFGTNHSNPCQFKPTPIHANPFETALIHVIYCPSCQSIQNCVSPLKAMPIHANPFKVHQSTQTDSIIPSLANPSKNVQVHTTLRESIKTHFNL